MAKPIICDTSVWLYLGQIGQVGLLERLYDPVYVTEEVCVELDNGRINRPAILDPRQLSAVRPLLKQLQQEGFHISESLKEYALQRAKEA